MYKLEDGVVPSCFVSAGGCGTFYAIHISSEAFRGLPTVKQHRLVNEVLKKEIEGIHGLQVCMHALPQQVYASSGYSVTHLYAAVLMLWHFTFDNLHSQ